MLKRQIDQYDMLLAVENHFDDNTSAWSSNTPITAAKTALSAKIDEIATEVATQLLIPTGITADKASLRSDLEHKAFTVSSALSGYAAGTPDKKTLYDKVHYTKTDLSKFREAELLGIVTNLHREATTELSNLAPFGVTTGTLTALLSTNNAFGAIMKNPTEAIEKRKSATDKIAVLIPEALDMLETRMDNLIVALNISQPQFTSIYTGVRAINTTASNPLSLTVTTMDAATNQPIANAKIEIVGEAITRTSSQRGYNTVQNLTSGPHKLTVTHPQFATRTLPFTVVSGETTELVVLLESITTKVL